MTLDQQPNVRCREIVPTDMEPLIAILTAGFGVGHDFWVRAFDRLTRHDAPDGLPKYGYLLEADGRPVGVLLLIFSSVSVAGRPRIRCNVSSWHVSEAFRSYAPMLVARALAHKHVTYVNITPAAHTYPILEAQGYERYCTGRFVTAPALLGWRNGDRVAPVTPDLGGGEDLSPEEVGLLLAHQRFGCISVTCGPVGRRRPFVFTTRRKFGVLPVAELVHCRDPEDFVRCAGPLGRFLARRGILLVIVGANGPIDGLAGRYVDAQPRYFRGPDRPCPADLAYTERVLFGV